MRGKTNMYYYYCKRCGRIINDFTNERKNGCDCCESIMQRVPDEYRDIFPITEKEAEELREKYVKTSPEFDQYLFDNREKIIKEKNVEFQKEYARVMEMVNAAAKPKVECPYCHSTDTAKISAASKAGSVFFFGLFSQKVRHQWHCNKCGSDF